MSIYKEIKASRRLNACECDLKPIEHVVLRNSEDIASLQYEFIKIDENLETELQQNSHEMKTMKSVMTSNQDQMEKFRDNLTIAFLLIKREAKFLKKLGIIETETAEAVLQNTAEIDKIEDSLKVRKHKGNNC